MEDYIFDVREKLLTGGSKTVLFVNYAGKPITRQGMWKVLEEYGQAAQLSISLTS